MSNPRSGKLGMLNKDEEDDDDDDDEDEDEDDDDNKTNIMLNYSNIYKLTTFF